MASDKQCKKRTRSDTGYAKIQSQHDNGNRLQPAVRRRLQLHGHPGPRDQEDGPSELRPVFACLSCILISWDPSGISVLQCVCVWVGCSDICPALMLICLIYAVNYARSRPEMMKYAMEGFLAVSLLHSILEAGPEVLLSARTPTIEIL